MGADVPAVGTAWVLNAGQTTDEGAEEDADFPLEVHANHSGIGHFGSLVSPEEDPGGAGAAPPPREITGISTLSSNDGLQLATGVSPVQPRCISRSFTGAEPVMWRALPPSPARPFSATEGQSDQDRSPPAAPPDDGRAGAGTADQEMQDAAFGGGEKRTCSI